MTKNNTYKPNGFSALSPYLVLNQAADFIIFAKKIFQAEVLEQNLAPDGAVRHAALKIGDSVLMVGQAHNKTAVVPGHLHLYVSDLEQTYQLAMKSNCQSIEMPATQPYGDYRAAFQDPWQNIWWIAQYKPADI